MKKLVFVPAKHGEGYTHFASTLSGLVDFEIWQVGDMYEVYASGARKFRINGGFVNPEWAMEFAENYYQDLIKRYQSEN